MKTTLAFCLIAVTALAGWREDCPIKDDYRKSLEWIAAPVAWSTNVTPAVTNILDRAAVEPHKTIYGIEWQYRVTLGKYTELCGVDVDGSFPANFEKMLGYAATLTNENDAVTRDLFLVDSVIISTLYTKLGSLGSDFSGTRYVTNVIPESVTYTPSRYRYEDYGLTNAPTVEDFQK